jgi:hypothetical protein
MKWSLNVWMAFSAMLRRCSSGGTSLYVILNVDPSANTVASIANFILFEHWLSRIWCFGTIPCRRIRSSILVCAAISVPSS